LSRSAVHLTCGAHDDSDLQLLYCDVKITHVALLMIGLICRG
jgi:hypothetical protein